MAKYLRYSETLYYYDTVQIFIGVDRYETRYICLLVEIKEPSDIYLCTPCSPSDVKQFVSGEIDLLQIL